MERITGRNKKGDLLVNGKMVYAGEFYEIASILEEYENLEEQGKLLILPCKPGDTIYLLVNDGVNKPFIKEWKALTFMYCISLKNKIGKTVFLTEREAKEALEGMKE